MKGEKQMTETSTTKLLLAHLKAGRSLTTWQAINIFHCTRLAARVFELKERGIKVKTRMLTLRTGVRVAQYSL